MSLPYIPYPGAGYPVNALRGKSFIGKAGKSSGVVTPPLDGLAPTSAFSASRKLMSAYGGAFYKETASRVDTLYDQSGNARNMVQATAGNQPVVATVGGVPAVDFDGAGRYLEGALLSALIANNAAFIVVSFVPDTADQTGGAPTVNCIVGDAADGGNIVMQTGGNLFSMQFDGAYKTTAPLIVPFGNPIVASMRKDGTNLYARVNLGDERLVACGNLTALNFNMRLSSIAPRDFDGKIFEMATWAVVPAAGVRDTIVSALMSQSKTAFGPNLTGYPSAANTGYSGTLTASPGDMEVTVPGTTIQNLNITGQLKISANNVTVKNCKVSEGGFYAITIGDTITGTIIQDTTIDGLGTGNNTSGIRGGGTFTRLNISNCENGIDVKGVAVTTIQDCYIHDLFGTASPHYDGIECNGGNSNVTIKHNTISLAGYTQTSGVNVNNFFGPISTILVDDNLMIGGGYNMYSDGQFSGGSITGVTITNNKWGGAANGTLTYNNNTPTISGNVDYKTGIAS